MNYLKKIKNFKYFNDIQKFKSFSTSFPHHQYQHRAQSFKFSKFKQQLQSARNAAKQTEQYHLKDLAVLQRHSRWRAQTVNSGKGQEKVLRHQGVAFGPSNAIYSLKTCVFPKRSLKDLYEKFHYLQRRGVRCFRHTSTEAKRQQKTNELVKEAELHPNERLYFPTDDETHRSLRDSFTQRLIRNWFETMNRWFFADEPEVCKKPVWSDEAKVETVDAAVGVVEDTWHFSVKVDRPLGKNERVAITGDCDSMGNWQPFFMEIMKYDPKIDRYTIDLTIPRDRDVNYRYAIIAVENNPIHGAPCRRTAIRQWENHLLPRTIRQCQTKLVIEEDVFGLRDEALVIDHGWAMTETYIQFKFFAQDLISSDNICPTPMFIKITPLFAKKKEAYCERLSESSTDLPSDFYCGEHPNPTFAFVEVVDLTQADSTMEMQGKYGAKCGPEQLTLFHLTLGDFERTAYRFDIYSYSRHAHDDEPPYHYAYGCLKYEQVEGSEGSVELELTCASKFRPRGTLKIEYLVINNTYGLDLTMAESFAPYWNPKHDGKLIGHRGCGLSYIYDDGIFRENTIYSLDRAFANGADMLELDVMLSKDMVPTVYHDYMVNLALKAVENLVDVLNEHDVLVFPAKYFDLKDILSRGIRNKKCFMAIPVAKFTQEEMQNIKVLRYATDKLVPPACMSKERLTLQHPFPELAWVLDQLPVEVPLLLEIKWPQKESTGFYEEKFKQFMDRNEFVDSILEVVFKKANCRKIYFACFDVDICVMLRYKQNFYPVILNYDHDYADVRLRNFHTAVSVAKIHGFLGISVRDSIIFNDPTNICHALANKLLVFTWGSLSNWEKNRKVLRSYGVNGLIFDRIDQKSDNAGIPLKKNVFVYEGIQCAKEIDKIYNAEIKKRIGKSFLDPECNVPIKRICKCRIKKK